MPVEAPPALSTATPPPAAKPAASVSPPPSSTPPPGPKEAGGRKSPVWDSLRSDLEKLPGQVGDQTPKPAAPAKPAPAKPDETSQTPPVKAPETPEAPGKPAAGEAPTGKDGKPEKANPWKLWRAEQARAAQLEKEAAELRTRALPEDKWREHQERLTAAEKRAQQYEDEIRYTNYQKSEEFRKSYEEPYLKAWDSAMGELGELQIEDPVNHTVRPFNSKDMMALCNMNLQDARRMADSLYGPLADDVMAHRKTIVELNNKQEQALKDAKENGAKREAERQERFQREHQETSRFLASTFESARQAAFNHPEHGKFLKPVEGDDEGNAILEKGIKFANDAFGQNPLAPGLTPAQRSQIVKQHAALINRAAAYSRLKLFNKRLETKVAELQKELEAYQASTPGNGNPTGGAAAGGPTSAREQVFGELRKLSH